MVTHLRESPIGLALGSVETTYGVSPLADPARATALVADLVGDPNRSSAADVAALRATLVSLREVNGPGPSRIDRQATIDASVSSGLARPDATDMLDVVLDSLGYESGDAAPKKSSTVPFLVGLAVVVALSASVAGFLVLSGGDDQDPNPEALDDVDPDDPNRGETEPVATDANGEPASDPEPDRQGLTATFAPVREGPFVVERGWRVTPDQSELIGLVRISAPDGQSASGTHRELVPSVVGDGSMVAWNPEPAQRVNTTAVFTAIEVGPGQILEIEFRAPLPTEEPFTEQDLLNWFEQWREQAEQLRPLGDSDEILEPLVSTES